MIKNLFLVLALGALVACNGFIKPDQLPQAPTAEIVIDPSTMTNAEACALVDKYNRLYEGYKAWGEAWIKIAGLNVEDFLKNVEVITTFKEKHAEVLATCNLESN